MPPKRASGLVSSKKRPHEAPTKGRKVFAGARQKVQRGGGGGGRRGRGADDEGADDPEGDDEMMEDAMDDDDGDDRARRAEGRGREEEESEEEIEETADEMLAARPSRTSTSCAPRKPRPAATPTPTRTRTRTRATWTRTTVSRTGSRTRRCTRAGASGGRSRRRVAAPTFGDHRMRLPTTTTTTARGRCGAAIACPSPASRSPRTTPPRTPCPRRAGSCFGTWRRARGPIPVISAGAGGLHGGGGILHLRRTFDAARRRFCAAFLAQERHLLCTAGADKRIHVWDTRSMAHVQELASHRLAVSVAGAPRWHRPALLGVGGPHAQGVEPGRHGVRGHAVRAPVGGDVRGAAAARARRHRGQGPHLPLLESRRGLAAHLPPVARRRADRVVRVRHARTPGSRAATTARSPCGAPPRNARCVVGGCARLRRGRQSRTGRRRVY